MIFVYIKDGNIVGKSQERLQTIECDQIIESTYGIKDKIILEDGVIIAYSQSKQRVIDRKEVGLKEENDNLKKVIRIERKKNETLMTDYVKLATEMSFIRKKAQQGSSTLQGQDPK